MNKIRMGFLIVICISIMSISIPVLADTSSRQENIKSRGILEFESGKIYFDSSDLTYLADEIDNLENTYKQATVGALNNIGTYFFNDGTITYDFSYNEVDTNEEKSELSFAKIIDGINCSQSVESLKQVQATDSAGNLLYYETEEASENGDLLALTTTDTSLPAYYQAASANSLSAGTAAWVNGTLIIGNGSDNAIYEEQGYRAGYTQGVADGLSKVNIQYTYHVHEGSSGETANGCYTMPQYHVHSAYGGSCYSPIYHWHGTNGCKYEEGWKCDRCIVCRTNGCVDLCGGSCGPYYYWSCGISEGQVTGYSISCGLTNAIIGYSLGCGKTTTTIESATIIY